MSFELENSNYDLKPVKFTVDGLISEVIKPPFPNQSYFWIIAGKAGSGKTSLLVNAMTNKLIYKKAFDKVILVQPKNSRSSIKNSPFDDLPEDQTFGKLNYDVLDKVQSIRKSFDELDKYKKKNRNQLLILDDVTSSLKDNEDILVELTTNRRHLKLSIILLVQFVRSISRSVRLQITHLTLFKPANQLETGIIEEEFINMPHNEFKKLCRFIWNTPYDFMMIDKQNEKYYKNLNLIKNVN